MLEFALGGIAAADSRVHVQSAARENYHRRSQAVVGLPQGDS